jgi:hypothetical protein
MQVSQQCGVQPPEWCVFIFLALSFCLVQVVAFLGSLEYTITPSLDGAPASYFYLFCFLEPAEYLAYLW